MANFFSQDTLKKNIGRAKLIWLSRCKLFSIFRWLLLSSSGKLKRELSAASSPTFSLCTLRAILVCELSLSSSRKPKRKLSAASSPTSSLCTLRTMPVRELLLSFLEKLKRELSPASSRLTDNQLSFRCNQLSADSLLRCQRHTEGYRSHSPYKHAQDQYNLCKFRGNCGHTAGYTNRCKG